MEDVSSVGTADSEGSGTGGPKTFAGLSLSLRYGQLARSLQAEVTANSTRNSGDGGSSGSGATAERHPPTSPLRLLDDVDDLQTLTLEEALARTAPRAAAPAASEGGATAVAAHTSAWEEFVASTKAATEEAAARQEEVLASVAALTVPALPVSLLKHSGGGNNSSTSNSTSTLHQEGSATSSTRAEHAAASGGLKTDDQGMVLVNAELAEVTPRSPLTARSIAHTTGEQEAIPTTATAASDVDPSTEQQQQQQQHEVRVEAAQHSEGATGEEGAGEGASEGTPAAEDDTTVLERADAAEAAGRQSAERWARHRHRRTRDQRAQLIKRLEASSRREQSMHAREAEITKHKEEEQARIEKEIS